MLNVDAFTSNIKNLYMKKRSFASFQNCNQNIKTKCLNGKLIIFISHIILIINVKMYQVVHAFSIITIKHIVCVTTVIREKIAK